jgi:Fur family ferric uptake transcriptional regulator
MACEEVFLRELHERGFRLTPQREMVLSVMHQVEGMATADEIYGRVQERSAAVDISTVYRTLDLLQEFRMVACVDPGDGQHRYELLGVHGPHVHLVCQECGALIGVELEVVQPLAERLLAAHGFALDLDGLTLPGLCRHCLAQSAPAD